MLIRVLAFLLIIFASSESNSAVISHFIGQGGNNECNPTTPCPARDAQLSHVQTISGDHNGNIYVGWERGAAQVNPDGGLINLGGIAGLGYVAGIAISPSGELYVASRDRDVIYKRITNDVFVTIAGTGVAGYNGDNIQASQAKLYCPSGLAFDSAGNLFVADACNYRIRKIDTNGIISTYIGNGRVVSSAESVTRTEGIRTVNDLAFDLNGALHFSEFDNFRIRKVNSQDKVVTVAGTSAFTSAGFVGDGGLAVNAKISFPRGITFTAENELLIAEQGSAATCLGNRVRKVDSSGIITTIAGTGICAHNGNGSEASLAAIAYPSGLFRQGESFYVGSNDYDGYVRRVGPLYLPGPPAMFKAHVNVDIGVYFNPGLADGGALITGYKVYASPEGGTDIHSGGFGLAKFNCSGPYCLNGFAHVVKDLMPGINYRLRVTALNSVGEGTPSEWSNIVSLPLPELSIGSASVNEGDSGYTNIGFPITLSKPAHRDLSVDFTADQVEWASGTDVAEPRIDYVPVHTTIIIPKGATSVVANVPVIGDILPERSEYFVALLSNPIEATISRFKVNASGYILDDEGVPLLSVNDYGITEGNSGANTINFSITLLSPAGPNGVSVDINTGYIRSTNQYSATPNIDYAATPRRIVFGAGEEIKSYSVKIIGDRQLEQDEVFGVFATNVVGAYLIKPNGIGRIFNDDAQNLLNSNGGRSNSSQGKSPARLCSLLADQIILFERNVALRKMKEKRGIKRILEIENQRSSLKCAIQ